MLANYTVQIFEVGHFIYFEARVIAMVDSHLMLQ